MSHFYGVLNGSRGEATRAGTKNSGLTATAASWDGAIEVRIFYDEKIEKNRYEVIQKPWHGRGVRAVIASGIVGETGNAEAFFDFHRKRQAEETAAEQNARVPAGWDSVDTSHD